MPLYEHCNEVVVKKFTRNLKELYREQYDGPCQLMTLLVGSGCGTEAEGEKLKLRGLIQQGAELIRKAPEFITYLHQVPEMKRDLLHYAHVSRCGDDGKELSLSRPLAIETVLKNTLHYKTELSKDSGPVLRAFLNATDPDKRFMNVTTGYKLKPEVATLNETENFDKRGLEFMPPVAYMQFCWRLETLGQSVSKENILALMEGNDYDTTFQLFENVNKCVTEKVLPFEVGKEALDKVDIDLLKTGKFKNYITSPDVVSICNSDKYVEAALKGLMVKTLLQGKPMPIRELIRKNQAYIRHFEVTSERIVAGVDLLPRKIAQVVELF